MHRFVNGILTILYIPFAFLCAFAGLIGDGLVYETNTFVLISYHIVTWCGILTALTAHLCLRLANRVYDSGRKAASYVIRFLPVLVMMAAFLIFAFAETIAKS